MINLSCACGLYDCSTIETLGCMARVFLTVAFGIVVSLIAFMICRRGRKK